jgi:hypothetical protein
MQRPDKNVTEDFFSARQQENEQNKDGQKRRKE